MRIRRCNRALWAMLLSGLMMGMALGCGDDNESSATRRRPSASPTPTPMPSALCSNTCEFANDGDCDDGGPGHDFDLCALGTDCGDCGPRSPTTPAGDPRQACQPANETCESNASCCEGAVCINNALGDGVARCADTCSTNADCSSGCCASLEGGGQACAPSSICD